MSLQAFPVNRRSLLSGALSLALPAMADAGSRGATIASDPSLDTALQALVNHPQYPLAGVSVLCLQSGKVVLEAQAGRRFIGDATHPDLPVTGDTLFRMASVSKWVVTLGVMRLVDAGKLDLDGDVGSILGYELRHPRYPQTAISPRLLLSHRASLSDEGGYRFDADVPLQSVLLPDGKHYADGRSWLTQRPGTYFQYCNFNFGVLASVMEKVSGQRFDRFMQAQVLGPLGMVGGFDPSQFSDLELANLATLYRKRSADERWDTSGPWFAQTDHFAGQRPPAPAVPATYGPGSNGTLFGPQGSLRTGLPDLARATRMLLQQGQWNGQRFLSRKSVQALLTEQWRYGPDVDSGDTASGIFQAWGVGLQHFIDRTGQQNRRGFGDRLLQRGGVRAWGHLGDAYGLNSGVIFDPERGNGVIYAVSGTGANPDLHRSDYSSFSQWEAHLLELAWSRVL